MSFYAVGNGLEIGIYTDWISCKKNIINFPNAKYKKFDTEQKAQEFINNCTGSKGSNKEDSSYNEDFIYIFTDGACTNNGREDAIAGIGIYFGEDDKRNVSRKINGKQTNNTAELSAIIEALHIVSDEKKDIFICTDSEYCIKCATSYGKKLEDNDWKSKTDNKCSKEPPNINLVKELYLLSQKANIMYKHILAHTDNDDYFSNGNRIADLLANKAIGCEECPYNTSDKKIYLKVAYKDKEDAKSLGAKWCPNKKLWYYIDKTDKTDKTANELLYKKYGNV